MSEGLRESPLDASWRAQSASVQERVLPHGRTVVSCRAQLGVGGLGRHMQEIADALDRAQQPAQCIGSPATPQAPGAAHQWLGRVELLRALAPAMRFSPAGRVWAGNVRFDAYAAGQLSAGDHLHLSAGDRLSAGDHLIAFNGSALAQFRAARRAGFESVSLVSANSHLRRVVAQHARAYRQYPVERPWAAHVLRRNLREYAQADRIYVASRYIWESFGEQGFPDEALSLFPLTPDPRFEPCGEPGVSTFDIVFVGSLVVHKGVPLLLDAFARLPHPDLRLVLVGGWKTRSMRRFVERACARDARIRVCPGDPLPHLRDARLCVHPSYEDGFAYAPAEALACGVPVLVSEDTGMKELIASDRDGLILPTGDVDALAEAIEAAYRGEILAG